MSAAASHDLVAAYQRIVSRIQSLAQSLNITNTPRLVAVSKTKPASLVSQLYRDTGHRHFGENYVKELCDKAPTLPPEIAWHFIGHLQSNKCKALVKIPNLFMVESVDSLKLACELNKACESARQSPLNILVQVNTSGEASKSGCEPEETVQLFLSILDKCPRLLPKGLMTIGRLSDRPEPECFDRLVGCKRAVEEELEKRGIKMDPLELSMGMSGDYELAIERGATSVRVGSSIFGARDYSKEMKDYAKEETKAEQPHSQSSQNQPAV